MKISYGRSKLSFKPVPVEKKIEAVYRTVAGEKIQPVEERNWSS